ncbi:MAG TPA: choice-of-anchor Q domain-containing protein [Rudaea sp.]
MTSQTVRLDSHKPLAALIAAAFALAPAQAAFAATYTVTSCADDNGSGTLRSIIKNMAGDNDIVDTGQLTCATITLTQGQIEVPQPNLSIEHKYHKGFQPTTTIMSNAGVGNFAPGRLLHHTGGGTLAIAGITLSAGVQQDLSGAANGGCIYSKGSVSLTSVSLSECLAIGLSVRGGAIYAAGSVSMSESSISITYAGGGTARGGAIDVGGSITLAHSSVSGSYTRSQTSAFGGAIVAQYGAVTLTDSVVTGNRLKNEASAARGAGIFATGGLTLTRSTVSYNSAVGTASDMFGRGQGGGAFAAGPIAISASVIDHNSAYYAGGLYLGSVSPVTISDSTIADNSAQNSAGGIRTTSSMTLLNSTVAFNHAPIGGGIVFDTLSKAATLGLQSSILADNVATDNPQGADLLVAGSQFSATAANNLVISANVVLPGNPLLACPRLEPLASNGGPTRTLSLMHDSPAVDTGNNNASLQYDQRDSGFARVFGPAADMGAYEWQGTIDERIFHAGFEPGCDE